MNFWDFKRSPASVRLLAEFGQEQGLDIGKILAGSRLKATDLDDPAIEIDASQELCVVGNLTRACRQPGLGLEGACATTSRPMDYGAWA